MKTAALALVLAACASSPPSPAPAPSAPVSPAHSSSEPTAASGRTVRVVRIDPRSFEAVVKTDLTTAKKWGADPANAMNVLPAFRHILVKAPAGNAEARASARRKADDLVARLDRGEDFATLAKSSDDPGSANRGGEYAGDQVQNFVVEVRRAYEALRPGERAREPVETQFGWHIIAKGPVDDQACVEGHRAWLARTTAERIARDVVKRLHHVAGGPVAAEVDQAYAAVLGVDRRKVESLPDVIRMSAETCDGLAAIGRNEGITWRDNVLVVAALTNDERDASEIESETCEPRTGGISPDELRVLIERHRSERRD